MDCRVIDVVVIHFFQVEPKCDCMLLVDDATDVMIVGAVVRFFSGGQLGSDYGEKKDSNL